MEANGTNTETRPAADRQEAGDNRAWLIINPAAGPQGDNGAKAAEIEQRLTAAGWDIRLRQTTQEKSAAELAREAIQQGIRTVLVGGGDGTVGAVGAELAGQDTVLGIIPLGTFNNIARSVGISTDVAAACDVILQKHVREMDIGIINEKHFFFEAAGVGLDAALFPLGEEMKEGRWKCLLQMAKLTLRYPPQTFRLTFDAPPQGAASRKGIRDRTIIRRALLVVIANGPYYGGGFTVAPGARVCDGFLTVSIYRNFSKLELAQHFCAISLGRYRYSPKVETFKVKEVRVEGAHPLPVHADGVPIGRTPAAMRAVSHALRIFAPESPTRGPARAGAVGETETALKQGFAEVKNPGDAAKVLAELERQAGDTREEEIPKSAAPTQPTARTGPIKAAADTTTDEEKPAAVLAETARQVATAPPEVAPVLDQAIERAAGAGKSPTEDGSAVERGRSLLRQELLRRLKPLDAADAALFLQINHLPHPKAADRFFSWFSFLMTGGHAWIVVLLIGCLVDRKRARQAFLDVLPPLYLATCTVDGPIKAYFRRKRPFISVVRAIVVGRKPGSYSFPSGHSAAAFAGASLLARHYPRAAPLLFSIAALVAFSRVFLGAHYPGDVTSGSLTGILLARLYRGLLKRIFRR